MVLKSSRSTRCPYLFRSTTFGGFGLDDFEDTTWNSPELLEALKDGDDRGLLLLDGVVLVEVRVSDATYWLGEGVRTG